MVQRCLLKTDRSRFTSLSQKRCEVYQAAPAHPAQTQKPAQRLVIRKLMRRGFPVEQHWHYFSRLHSSRQVIFMSPPRSPAAANVARIAEFMAVPAVGHEDEPAVRPSGRIYVPWARKVVALIFPAPKQGFPSDPPWTQGRGGDGVFRLVRRPARAAGGNQVINAAMPGTGRRFTLAPYEGFRGLRRRPEISSDRRTMRMVAFRRRYGKG